VFQDSNHSTPVTLLFVHYGENWIRGSERCLLDLIRHLDPARYRAVLWCNSPAMARAAENLPVTVHHSDFPLLLGWNSPRFDLFAFLRLVREGIRLVKQHQVALIHANSGAPNQWLNLVARACRLPMVTHLHARYPLRDRLTLGLHHSAMVVGVSQPVVEQLWRDGYPRERTRVIPNGIDVGGLESQPIKNLKTRMGLKEDDFLLATVGSLIHRKGIDLIIEAVNHLSSQGITAHLTVIGDGEERQRLQAQTNRLGLSHRIHFLGEQEGVAGLLRNGPDLFVSGAREEVFGLVLAEAGLCGLPVVAPQVGGIPSVIRDGKSGILVNPDDPVALAGAMARLYNEPELRRQMGLAGRERVLQRFTIQQNATRFDQLYRVLLRDARHRMSWRRHWHWRAPLRKGIGTLWRMAAAKPAVEGSGA
jgi:glycosyltransferase involved in cell wall biosynthesis